MQFLKAAQQGYSTAQFNLGIFYANGKGGETNLAEAYKWCTLAAWQGDKDAAYKRNALLVEMSPKQISDGVRGASNFVLEKAKELRSEGIFLIDPKEIKPIVIQTNEVSENRKVLEEILPTHVKPVLENPQEPVKAKDFE